MPQRQFHLRAIGSDADLGLVELHRIVAADGDVAGLRCGMQWRQGKQRNDKAGEYVF
jgi:hypothetical protein